jgi:branched-subunit amino acid aminotransferase/4-amino-4-deoxychorismate lyase
VTVSTPVATYCLDGITRGVILAAARETGYRVEEVADMVVDDLTGADREVFLTGTGAGLVPVVRLGRTVVGEGTPGPVTRQLRGCLTAAMADPDRGLSLSADREAVEAYLARGSASGLNLDRKRDAAA